MSTAIPANFEGKFFLLVQITAADGKEEELAKLLKGMEAVSTVEAGTLSYHMGRGFGEDSNKFTIFETFANTKALEAHRETDAFKALKTSGAMGDIKITHYVAF